MFKHVGQSVYGRKADQTIEQVIKHRVEESTWGVGGEYDRVYQYRSLFLKLIETLHDDGKLPKKFIEYITPEGFEFCDENGEMTDD